MATYDIKKLWFSFLYTHTMIDWTMSYSHSYVPALQAVTFLFGSPDESVNSPVAIGFDILGYIYVHAYMYTGSLM